MQPNVLVKIDALDNSKEAFRSLKNNLDGVKVGIGGVKSKLDNLAPAFKKMAAVGAATLTGLTLIANKSISAYAEVERAQRQLEHAVIDVSKGTKGQVAQINELTASLEKKAGIDADSLTMGVAQLSTFGLSTDAVIGLTKSLADLTVNQSGINAGSEDYIQSANNIAKALNGQFGILEKSGIRFSEAQKNLILYGTETEKVAALQDGFNQNLRETTDTVDGVDLASAKMKRSMENISENIGKALKPAFEDLARILTPILEKIVAWSEANPQLVVRIIEVVAVLAVLLTAIGLIGLALPPIITGFGLIAFAIGAISAPILLIVGLLAVIGGAIYYLWSNWDMHVSNMKWAFEGLKEGVVAIVDYLKGVFDGFIGWLGDKVDAVVDLVKSALDALASLPGVESAIKVGRSALSSVKDLFRAEGGPVSSRTPYIVGERGPELFVPNNSGTIVPNNALQPSSAGGGAPIYVTITGNSFMGERDMAEKVGDQIIRVLKMNGRL